MKKQLLALSMVATSGLLAQTDAQMPNQAHEQNNCCNKCCCTPCCCVPKPKKCIDCECYTPAFYDLQCDWGFNFDAEFLYWYARETNLAYASKIQSLEVGGIDPLQVDPFLVFGSYSYQNLDTAWDPGLRLGIGFNSSCDGWDYNLTWTWFKNDRKDRTCVPNFSLGEDSFFLANTNEFLLLNPWINASFHNGIGPTSGGNEILTFDQVKASYRLRFNQIDFDIGRKYWLSACFNLRPFAGIRGYWTNVTFKTVSSRSYVSDDNAFNFTFSDKFKSRPWGVGLMAGFEPAWYFSSCFALYGKAGIAALWGDFEIKKTECYTGLINDEVVAPQFENRDVHKFSQMTGVLDLGLGLRWESTWCCDRYRTAVDLGWEHHVYMDQNHRIKTTDGISQTFNSAPPIVKVAGYRQFVEAEGDLGFGGFVLRFNFDF